MKNLLTAFLFITGFVVPLNGEDLIRFRLDIDLFGNAKITVAQAEGPLAPPGGTGAEAVKSNRWPKTRIEKSKNLVRFVHDFSDADPLNSLTTSVMQGGHVGAEIDKQSKMLSLSSSQGQPSLFAYGCRMRLPMSVVFDIVPMANNAATRIQLDFGYEVLVASIYKEGTETDRYKISSTWIDRKANSRVPLFQPLDCPTDGVVSQKFRLPVPNAEFKTPCWLLLTGGSQSKADQKIARLLVQGQAVPVIGIGFDERQGTIYAKTVFKGSAADKAGILLGDVVTEINDQQPTSVQHAIDLLSETQFGDSNTLRILRANEPVSVSIKFE